MGTEINIAINSLQCLNLCMRYTLTGNICTSVRSLVFATPETTDGLGKSTQTVPECNATNTWCKRVNNTQSLAVANRALIRKMDFLNA